VLSSTVRLFAVWIKTAVDSWGLLIQR